MTISRRWLPVALFLVIAGAGYLYWQYLIGDALPADIARGNGRIEAVEIDISTKARTHPLGAALRRDDRM